MSDFTAKDVQALRQATGAGMMDAKKALQENGGDAEAAAQWLREKGLAKAAKNSDRDNSQGSVALVVDGNVGAIVELKCETDFSAKSDDFTTVVGDLAEVVVAKGVDAVGELAKEIDDLKISKKENIEVGTVVRIEAADGNILDSYLHIQDGRGVNAVLVELAGGTQELAHDIGVHIAFTKPPYLTRDQVDAEAVEKERQALLDVTKAEGRESGRPPLRIDQPVFGMIEGRTLDRVVVVPRSAVRQLDRIYLIDKQELTLNRITIDPIWKDEEHVVVSNPAIGDGAWLATSYLSYTPNLAKVEIIPNSEEAEMNVETNAADAESNSST